MLTHEVIFEDKGEVTVKAEFSLRAQRGEEKKSFELSDVMCLVQGLDIAKVLSSDYIVNYHPNRLKGEWRFLLKKKKAPKVVKEETASETDVEVLGEPKKTIKRKKKTK